MEVLQTQWVCNGGRYPQRGQAQVLNKVVDDTRVAGKRRVPLIQNLLTTVEVPQVQYIDKSVGGASCVAAPSTTHCDGPENG